MLEILIIINGPFHFGEDGLVLIIIDLDLMVIITMVLLEDLVDQWYDSISRNKYLIIYKVKTTCWLQIDSMHAQRTVADIRMAPYFRYMKEYSEWSLFIPSGKRYVLT